MNLGQLVNQNSYAISAAIIVIVVAAEIARREISLRSIALLVLIAFALVLPVVLLRSPQVAAGELDQAMTAGKPVLLEVYSDL